jgi:hypothetical protein
MRKATTGGAVDPRHRVKKVLLKLEHPETSVQLDDWDAKLFCIYKLRDTFKSKYPKTWHTEFLESYPLYASLLDVYEDTTTGGDKDVVEAALLASLNCDSIANELREEKFSPLFLGMYRTLFYDVLNILGNPVSEFKAIVAPLTQVDSDKLAVGAIWKLLALLGGLPTLARKGFGTAAMKGEDLAYLLQLAAFRNCSMILKYANKGLPFFEDNPAAMHVLSTLAEFDGIRGSGRRLDYLAEISSVAKNNLSVLLSSSLKLLNADPTVTAELTVADGRFNPEAATTIEYHEHTNFLNNDNEVSDED